MTKKSIRTLDALIHKEFIESKDISQLQKVTEHFSLAITPDMYQLIDKKNPQDPIAKQFVPSTDEIKHFPYELPDPIGDETHKPVKGIVHRYPDRCLFLPVHVCPVYCRFCFRKEKVGSADETLSPAETEAAITYIQSHPEIWEVILTGGDPFILKPVQLKKMIEQINKIPHVEIIRIHTRVPFVDPARINNEMINALKCDKTVYVLVHTNHPKEFTPTAIQACNLLVENGIPLLSQTTLLKDINDDIETLSTLMRCLVKHRIKPYYLHHCDLAKGTQHFRTSIAKGQTLIKQLRGRFSGLCQPTYVLDIPGGFGKSPLTSTYIHVKSDGEYIIEDYLGSTHHYCDHS